LCGLYVIFILDGFEAYLILILNFTKRRRRSSVARNEKWYIYIYVYRYSIT